MKTKEIIEAQRLWNELKDFGAWLVLLGLFLIIIGLLKALL
jgi:hypothetical protein